MVRFKSSRSECHDNFVYMHEHVRQFCFHIIVVMSFAAEVGDHDPDSHDAAFVSEFRFVSNQNEEFEFDVLEAFKKCK